MLVIVGITVVPRMAVLVVASGWVVVGLASIGVPVREAVGVLVGVLMGMGVQGLSVAVGVRVQVLVRMAVLVFVLQLPDGVAAVSAVDEGEAVEAAQGLVLHEFPGGKVEGNPALVHDQGPAGQFAHEKHVVADQEQGRLEIG